MVFIILFGAPGSGKGTLASRIKEFSPVVHISTGDLFRDNISRQTPLGIEAQRFIDQGQLVPDDVTIRMVKDRLNRRDVQENGAMLDGFPRTLGQARALNEIARIDSVAVINIGKEELRPRITGRRNCPRCNKIYNIHHAPSRPKVEGRCDNCPDQALQQRSDDNEVTFEKRWNTYVAQSEAVIELYTEAGLVVEFDPAVIFRMPHAEIAHKLNLNFGVTVLPFLALALYAFAKSRLLKQ